MAPRFLGLDLAWMTMNPSGLAALDERGRLLDLRTDLRGDDAVLAWIRSWAGERGAIAIDMPTIVRNERGQRPCERELRADFHAHEAGPYPANSGLAPFAGGGRAGALLAALRADGVVHTADVAPGDPRVVAFETFPHAAAVRLFDLARTKKYKKKNARPWPAVLDAWAELRVLLDGLAAADPALRLDERLLPRRATRERYKRWDDAIDAVLCAYVASYVWRHGTRTGAVRVYGDMDRGHIVIPAGPPGMNRTPGGYTGRTQPGKSGASNPAGENRT